MPSWLEGGPPRGRPRRPSNPPPADDAPAVDFHVIRCPNDRCRSQDTYVYSTQPPSPNRIRYHKCRRCSQLFKSVEVTSDT
jgi:hypothetical protein